MGRRQARRRLRDLQRRVAICNKAFRYVDKQAKCFFCSCVVREYAQLKSIPQQCVHSAFGSLEGWTFAQRLLGVTTHYKLHKEDGSITIRIQGELTGCSVFDQVRVGPVCGRGRAV